MLASLCSKSFKLGFSSMWTNNFQRYKLELEKAEESEIKLPTFVGSFQKNFYFCFIDYTKTFDSVDHNKPWKILEELGIPEHLTCLLRNLHAGLEATLRILHETTDWLKIWKGVWQGWMLSPCLSNLHAEYIMQSARLDESQAWI